MHLLSVVFSALAVVALSRAAAPPQNPVSGLTMAIQSDKQYCFFLPSKPGVLIGLYEHDAKVFCSAPTPQAPGALIFPSGFVTSVHFLSTSTYVQITGAINGNIYVLPTDDGGQFDHKNSPPLGSCAGYPYFVNMVEPSTSRFCARCCQAAADCSTSLSTFGCPTIIPGDYTGVSEGTSGSFALNANASASAPGGNSNSTNSSLVSPPSPSIPSSGSSIPPLSSLLSLLLPLFLFALVL